jgi:hypothetical protein
MLIAVRRAEALPQFVEVGFQPTGHQFTLKQKNGVTTLS